ncbi:cation-transporting ATPase, putative, partial [Eimeria tenella]
RTTSVAEYRTTDDVWRGPLHQQQQQQQQQGQQELRELLQQKPKGFIVAVKGAPERIKQFLGKVPPFYDSVADELTGRGLRVLAVAARMCTTNPQSSPREALERDLLFCGFLAFAAAIKPGVQQQLQLLRCSGQQVVMLTGDHALTAAAVAADVGIIHHPSTCGVPSCCGCSSNNSSSSSKEATGKLLPLFLSLSEAEETIETSHGSSQQMQPRARRAAAAEEAAANDSFCSSGSSSSSSSVLERRVNRVLQWVSSDSNVRLPFAAALTAEPSRHYSFCVCGTVLQQLRQLQQRQQQLRRPAVLETAEEQEARLGCREELTLQQQQQQQEQQEQDASQQELLRQLVRYVRVFARLSPREKQQVVHAFAAEGFPVLMCGDGANDIGALKTAAVGVSVLSSAPCAAVSAAAAAAAAAGPGADAAGAGRAGAAGFAATQRQQQQLSPQQQRQQLLERTLEGLAGESTLVPLGSASVAAAFTCRDSGIGVVSRVVSEGRCCLSSLLLMHRLIALNCTVTAFSLSVLSTDGVRYSDLQAAIESCLSTTLTLCLSASPEENAQQQQQQQQIKGFMGNKPPPTSVFSFWGILSLVGQGALHVWCLARAWVLARALRDSSSSSSGGTSSSSSSSEDENLFKPDEVNTAVFYLSLCMHLSTFLANYEGAPWSQPLRQNRRLWRMLLGGFLVLLLLLLQLLPFLNQALELVLFTDTRLQLQLQLLILLDIFGPWAIAAACRKAAAFREGPLKPLPLQQAAQLQQQQQ